MKKWQVLMPSLVASASLPLVALAGCGTKVKATSIRIVQGSTKDLRVTETFQLSCVVEPSDATDKTISWSTTNEEIATVDQNGLVTATGEGDATIIATLLSDRTISDSFNIHVDPAIQLRGIEILEGTEGTLPYRHEKQLSLKFTPSDATDKRIIWSSSDETVATIDQNGKIFAVNEEGETTITATSVADDTITASYSLTVTSMVPVESLEINGVDEGAIMVNNTKQLAYTITPSDATDKEVEWTSSNNSIATVDANGKITGVAKGTATIKVTHKTERTHTDSYQIRVVDEDEIKKGTFKKLTFNITNGTLLDPPPQLLVGVWLDNRIQIKPDVNYGWPKAEDIKITGAIPDFSYYATDTHFTKEYGVIALKNVYDDVVIECTCPEAKKIASGIQDKWGAITLKYDLYDNHECRLTNYVSGTGTLWVTNAVKYKGYEGDPGRYYVRQIPKHWADGDNDVAGIDFVAGEDSYPYKLRKICDSAFYSTNALDNYIGKTKLCEFPEGLEEVGDSAFYKVDLSPSNDMLGFVFPSTLKTIKRGAFSEIPYIRKSSGILRFNSHVTQFEYDAFDQANYNSHTNIYAPTQSAYNAMWNASLHGDFYEPTKIIGEYQLGKDYVYTMDSGRYGAHPIAVKLMYGDTVSAWDIKYEDIVGGLKLRQISGTTVPEGTVTIGPRIQYWADNNGKVSIAYSTLPESSAPFKFEVLNGSKVIGTITINNPS